MVTTFMFWIMVDNAVIWLVQTYQDFLGKMLVIFKKLKILSSLPRETPDFLAGPTDQPPGGGEPVHPVPLHAALQEQGHLLSDMDTHQYRPGTNTQYIRQAHHTEKYS